MKPNFELYGLKRTRRCDTYNEFWLLSFLGNHLARVVRVDRLPIYGFYFKFQHLNMCVHGNWGITGVLFQPFLFHTHPFQLIRVYRGLQESSHSPLARDIYTKIFKFHLNIINTTLRSLACPYFYVFLSVIFL